MPPRDPSLPEGTDHIIDTNIDLGDNGTGGGVGGAGSGGAGGGGSGGTGGATGAGAGAATGASGGSAGSAFQFDKQGDGSSGSGGSGITGQIREQFNTLKSQAGDRARGLADDGKRQTTDFLQTVARIVEDAAGSVEERLGGQYAGFGRRASESISSLASTLDERSVDDLIENARTFVQRSPAVAIGIAAVVGFAVARVARSSISEVRGQSQTGGSDGGAGGTDVTPAGGAGSTSGMGGGTAGASGGLNATGGAFGEGGAGTAGNVGGTGTSSSGAGSTGAGSSAPTY